MAREKWTDEDRSKVLRVHEEVLEQYKDIQAMDRYAIVASRIARDGFRPNANAVGSMISSLQKPQPAKNGHAPIEDTQVLERVEVLYTGLQETVEMMSKSISLREEEVLDVAKAALRSFGELSRDIKEILRTTTEHQKQQQKMLEKIIISFENSTSQTKLLDKMCTSLDVLCEQMDTLVNGLKEAESNG